MKAAWAWGGLAAALWVPWWVSLSVWWRSDAAHAHGWLAPLFAAWLAAGRWADRPELRPPGRVGRIAAGGVALGLLGGWAAALVVLAPNALWPTGQWLAGLAAAGVWLAAAWREGGGRWARHFGWVALFPLCAAAWPAAVQARLLETLSPWIAMVAGEIVNAGGRLAVAQGAVIEVAGGWVGVDEACSGLRSLEAAVLMAWFLGEHRRLALRGRLGLLAGALALALAGNVARATWLVWSSAGGEPVVSKALHDGTGLLVMVATLAGVLAWAERFREGRRDLRNHKVDTGLAGGRGVRFAAGVGLAAAGLALAGRGWYALGADDGVATAWHLREELAEGWSEAPEPAGAQSNLHVSRVEARSGKAAGWQGLACVLGWEGDVVYAENAFIHGPEVCFPAIGTVLEAPLGVQAVAMGGREVPWVMSRYVTPNRLRQHVWAMRWDGWRDGPALTERGAGTPWAIRRAAVRERRSRGAMALLVVVGAGFADDEAARAWFAEWGPRLLELR